MSYQVLARKYRPQKFSEVIGQDHVTRTLKNAIEQQRIAHGYIFSGHRGIGKTTIARILAMALNCRKNDRPNPEPCGECESCTEIRAGGAVDVIEIDAATNRGIDEIRELREAARYRPARDRYKIYILDEAHQITDAAFNALLKTLEEPPPHIIFMMATTQPEDIPQTIRSRCQHFSFHAVRFDDIVGQLKAIAKHEKIAVEDDAVAVLAEAGDGSMRDALSIMDQAIAGNAVSATITAEQVRGLVGSVSSEILESLMNSVGKSSSQEVLQLIDKLVTEGQSPMHFVKQLVRFLRNAVVARVAGADSQLLQISQDERARVQRVANQFAEEDLTRFLNIALRTHDDLGYKQEQRFHLELGILKMVHAQRMLPLEELLSQQPIGSGGSRSTQTAAPSTSTRAAAPERTSVPERVASPSTPSAPSPFESDRARKGRSSVPEMSGGVVTALTESSAKSTAIATAAAVATAIAIADAADTNKQGSHVSSAESAPRTWGTRTDVENAEAKPSTRQIAPIVESDPSADVGTDQLRGAVIGALEDAGQGMLANMLDSSEWSLEGADLTIKVVQSAVMIDMSFGAEPKKMVNAAATKSAGRPIRVKVVSGGNPNAAPSQPAHRGTSRPSGSARSRAAEDPMVKYMQEKFGAEIRTVIDQQSKDQKD
ncbi:MAG: polymerase tau subunit [Acidobacteriales bacterium]|nr:polymerase tau subunit [Terriglobales bacterium]